MPAQLSLFGTLSLEENITDNLPEILPVGTERMLQIGFQINPFTLLNLIECFRHVDIERRQKAWLGLYPKVL